MKRHIEWRYQKVFSILGKMAFVVFLVAGYMASAAPANTSTALANEPHFVYRIDTRSPAELFTLGLQARGNNFQLVDHVASTAQEREEDVQSAFISTTTSQSIAEAIGASFRARDIDHRQVPTRYYVYEIRATNDFYGTSRSLNSFEESIRNFYFQNNSTREHAQLLDELDAVFASQLEWVALLRIDRTLIRRAFEYRPPINPLDPNTAYGPNGAWRNNNAYVDGQTEGNPLAFTTSQNSNFNTNRVLRAVRPAGVSPPSVVLSAESVCDQRASSILSGINEPGQCVLFNYLASPAVAKEFGKPNNITPSRTVASVEDDSLAVSPKASIDETGGYVVLSADLLTGTQMWVPQFDGKTPGFTLVNSMNPDILLCETNRTSEIVVIKQLSELRTPGECQWLFNFISKDTTGKGTYIVHNYTNGKVLTSKAAYGDDKRRRLELRYVTEIAHDDTQLWTFRAPPQAKLVSSSTLTANDQGDVNKAQIVGYRSKLFLDAGGDPGPDRPLSMWAKSDTKQQHWDLSRGEFDGFYYLINTKTPDSPMSPVGDRYLDPDAPVASANDRIKYAYSALWRLEPADGGFYIINVYSGYYLDASDLDKDKGECAGCVTQKIKDPTKSSDPTYGRQVWDIRDYGK